jgi:hypothetical protein
MFSAVFAYVGEYAVKRYAAYPREDIANTIDADPGEIGSLAETERSVGVHVDPVIAKLLGKIDDVGEAMIPVPPQVGLAAFKIEIPDALSVLIQQMGSHLAELHGDMVDICDPAMPAGKIADIGDN